TLWRGQGHGLASFLLPTRLICSRVALRHVACHWVQSRSARLTRGSSTPAQAFHRAQSVRGPDAQASATPLLRYYQNPRIPESQNPVWQRSLALVQEGMGEVIEGALATHAPVPFTPGAV